jgi:two-component system sensor histidine kinase/response regulator
MTSGATLPGSYDAGLVALSVVIALLASGAALDLAGRVTAARGRTRLGWLAGGAFAMGLGIWSMHYTGMEAFVLPVPVLYHVPTVALSLLAAVIASAIALFVASRARLGAAAVLVGSVTMGAGIAGMHYIGMAAMRVPAEMHWRAPVIALSVAVAIAISFVALWFTFLFGHGDAPGWTRRQLGAAVVMGAAIPVMHYIGMAAVSFTARGEPVAAGAEVGVTALGSLAVAGVTLTVLGVAILVSVVDRRVAAERYRSGLEQARLVEELTAALAQVKTLRGLLPLCAQCRRVRTERGSWEQIESYVRAHSLAEFSHGLCPDCEVRWQAEMSRVIP